MSYRTIIITTTGGRVIDFSGHSGFGARVITPGMPVSELWPAVVRRETTNALDRIASGHAVEDLPTLMDERRRLRVSGYPLMSDGQLVDRLLLIVDPLGEWSPVPESGLKSGDALTEMASVLAHELRNPLAAVRSAVELIGRHLPGPQRVVIEQVTARIDAMDALLDDLLTFSTAPTPSVKPLALEPLIHDVVTSVAGNESVVVHVESSGAVPLVQADDTLLRGVFLHLLMNALQATDDGTPVEIVIEGNPDSVSTAIIDHGRGFSSGARDAMFRPFFTTKARGTGLGLPTARRLVEAQGGQITVESRPTGARVVVTLPAA